MWKPPWVSLLTSPSPKFHRGKRQRSQQLEEFEESSTSVWRGENHLRESVSGEWLRWLRWRCISMFFLVIQMWQWNGTAPWNGQTWCFFSLVEKKHEFTMRQLCANLLKSDSLTIGDVPSIYGHVHGAKMINHELIFRCSKRFTDPDNPRYLSIGFPKGAAITTMVSGCFELPKNVQSYCSQLPNKGPTKVLEHSWKLLQEPKSQFTSLWPPWTVGFWHILANSMDFSWFVQQTWRTYPLVIKSGGEIFASTSTAKSFGCSGISWNCIIHPVSTLRGLCASWFQ